ncbi:MAG: glycosyltransferase family 2 protein [Patescibacteria group bacterium]
MSNIKLSVIIVNYNTRELLRKCLRSVFVSETNFDYEVLVSDNDSADGSTAMIKRDFPQVRLLENHANLGFSKGNNVALRQASGKYLLLLNSDTEVAANTFNVSIGYLESHKEVGILGGKVLLPDGRLDVACRRKFPNPWNSFLRLFGLKKFSDYNIVSPVDAETEVDAVMGAYLLIRRETLDKIGLLDEAFFMYGEDLDWCWRAKVAGYKVIYYPRAEIIHFKYGSSQAIPFRTIRAAHQAMLIFYKKHYAPRYLWLFNQLIYLGIWVRMYLVLVVNLFRKKKTVH